MGVWDPILERSTRSWANKGTLSGSSTCRLTFDGDGPTSSARLKLDLRCINSGCRETEQLEAWFLWSGLMSYAALMVYVDVDGIPEQRVRIASELAAKFDAALIGF